LNHKPIDKLMLILVASAILVLALLNIFQTDRPTVSESENRNLATWPEFSIADVASGKYFADIGAFFSDTFFGREAMVNFSKKLDLLKGLFDDDFSVIINPNPTDPTEPDDETLPTLPPITRPTEPSTQPTIPTDPIVDPTDPSIPNTQPTEPVIPISLSKSKVSLTVGAAHMLTATVGDGYSNLKWTTDKSSVATVTDNGDGTASVKAVAAGYGSGLVYKLISRKNKIVATFVASATAPILNTGIFILGGLFLVGDTLSANFVAEGTTLIYFVVIGCAGLNFIGELVANLALSPAIVTITDVITKTMKKNK
jgi:hypothetical protein